MIRYFRELFASTDVEVWDMADMIGIDRDRTRVRYWLTFVKWFAQFMLDDLIGMTYCRYRGHEAYDINAPHAGAIVVYVCRNCGKQVR